MLDLLPFQPGDAPDSFADVRELQAAVGYTLATKVRDGGADFVS